MASFLSVGENFNMAFHFDRTLFSNLNLSHHLLYYNQNHTLGSAERLNNVRFQNKY
jgi:hypothetical protein